MLIVVLNSFQHLIKLKILNQVQDDKLTYFRNILLFLLSIIFFSTNVFAASLQPIPQKTLKVILNTSDLQKPAVVSTSIENLNPEQYKTSFMNYFYVIEMKAADGTSLMKGEVKKQNILAAPLAKNATNVPADGPYNITPNKLVLNLPLFEDVVTITISDEANKTLLTIDAEKAKLNAASRMAECNACGYCLQKTPPDGVEKCMECLYPGLALDDSLRVDPDTGTAPGAVKGRYYTQLGCVDTQPGALLNFFLSKLVFPITGILALLALIYGAYLLITSQDNPEQIQKGRLWIIGAIVGAVFVFSAVLLVQTVGKDILKIPGIN